MNYYTSNNTKGFLAQEIPSPYLSNNTKVTNPNSISGHTEMGDSFVNVVSAKNAPNVYAHSLMDVMDVIGKDFFVTLRDYLLIKVPNVNYNTHITSVSLIDIIANAEARAVLLRKYDSGYDIEYFRQLVKYVNYVMSMCNVESLSKSAFGAISQLTFYEVGEQLQGATNGSTPSNPSNPKHTSISNVVHGGVSYTSTIEPDIAGRVSSFL
jgi:hypothetical protein